MTTYKIYYSGILCFGYVTISMGFKKPQPTKLPATKFKFKMIAKICCWLLNKTDSDFKTYQVVSIDETDTEQCPCPNLNGECVNKGNPYCRATEEQK